MRAEWVWAVVVTAFVTVVAPRASRGSTCVLLNESELAASAVAAVTGVVTAIESADDPANAGINTCVHIAPDTVVFGSLPAGDVVLREVGGRLHGRTEWIHGSPQYRVG